MPRVISQANEAGVTAGQRRWPPSDCKRMKRLGCRVLEHGAETGDRDGRQAKLPALIERSGVLRRALGLVHGHRRMIHPIGLQASGYICIFPVFVNVPNESVH